MALSLTDIARIYDGVEQRENPKAKEKDLTKDQEKAMFKALSKRSKNG